MKNDYDAEYDPEHIIGGSNNGGLRWMSMLVMVLVVFGFFSLVWYAYNASINEQQEENVAVIAPDYADYKEKPEESGGMEINNKDIEAYQLMRRQPSAEEEVEKVERLLPESQTPIVLPTQKESDPALAAEVEKIASAEATMTVVPQKETIIGTVTETTGTAGNNDDVVKVTDASSAVAETTTTVTTSIREAVNTVAPIAASIPSIAATTVKTETIKTETLKPALPTVMSEKSALSNKLVVPTQAVGSVTKQPVQIKESAPVIAKLQVTPLAPTASPVIASAPQVLKLPLATPAAIPTSTPQVLATIPKPTIPPAIKPAIATTPPAPSASNGGVYVQLGALRSASEAERLWSQLRVAHPDLLGNASRSVEAVTVAGTGTLYRLRARGFASRATALSACSNLKTRGQDCLVAQ